MNMDLSRYSALAPSSAGRPTARPATMAQLAAAADPNILGSNSSDIAARNGMSPDPLGTVNGGSGFGWNMDTLNLLAGGVQSLGSLWMGNQALKQANRQFNSQMDFANKNMANQTQNYNTQLEQQAMSMGSQMEWDQAQLADYVQRNRL